MEVVLWEGSDPHDRGRGEVGIVEADETEDEPRDGKALKVEEETKERIDKEAEDEELNKEDHMGDKPDQKREEEQKQGGPNNPSLMPIIINVEPPKTALEAAIRRSTMKEMSKPNPKSKYYDDLLVAAVLEEDEDLVQDLLSKGGSFGARNADGQTLMHLAVLKDNASIIQLLFEKGADTEADNADGIKPLHLAVILRKASLVKLLLRLNANVESFNQNNGKTAFYVAVETSQQSLAEVLLENGANIDARLHNGYTPLICAIVGGKRIPVKEQLPLVRFLLSHGANKYIESGSGRNARHFAAGDNYLIELLDSNQLQDGPSMGNSASQSDSFHERRFTHMPSLPAGEVRKAAACHGFQATIVDFYLEERERRIHASSSVYDLLYGRGPGGIMAAERGDKMSGQKPVFRWYHLPANNLEWMEILAQRISNEHPFGPSMLNEETKSRLALRRPIGQKHIASTAQSSFLTPLAHTVKPRRRFASEASMPEHVMLFIPFLHWETYAGYERMITAINQLKPAPVPHPPLSKPRYRGSARQKFLSRENSFNQSEKQKRGFQAPSPVIQSEDDEEVVVVEEEEPIKAFDQRVKSNTNSGRIVHGAEKVHSVLRNVKDRVKIASHQIAMTVGLVSNPTADLEAAYNSSSSNSSNLRLSRRVDAEPVEKKGDTDYHRSDPPHNKTADNGIDIEDTHVTGDRTDVGAVKNISRNSGKNSAHGFGMSSLAEDNYSEIVESEKHNSTPSNEHYQDDDNDLPPKTTATRHMSIKTGNSVSPKAVGLSPKEAPRLSSKVEPGSGLSGSNVAAIMAPKMEALSAGAKHTSAIPVPPKVMFTTSITKEEATPNYPTEERTTFAEEEQTPAINELGNKKKTKQAVEGEKFAPRKENTFRARVPPPSYRGPEILPGSLHEHLTRGYLQVKIPGEIPALQLRRTLDQYYYTHLTTTERDSDQVVYRHIKKFTTDEPKIFMIDQLWLWILNEDTIISCFPQCWDLPEDPTTKRPPPMPPKRQTSGYSPFSGPSPLMTTSEGLKSNQAKTSTTRQSPILAWMTGSTKKRPTRKDSLDSEYSNNEQRRPQISEKRAREARNNHAELMQNDPLNVHEIVMRYLQRSARAPVTSVFDLASIITDTCVNLFARERAPEEFQFLEFFERSIGIVVDKDARCFRDFADSAFATRQKQSYSSMLDKEPAFNINEEIQLVAEIKDIREELGILKMVLNDQLPQLRSFREILHEKSDPEYSHLRIDIVESHLRRIKKMEELANQTYDSLNHLIDLKQKQANVLEAFMAREQAKKSEKKRMERIQEKEIWRTKQDEQSERAIQQGRTTVLFTVITIIFLPLSFIAAFFAINIDAFPTNDDGKLPMNYVLKYLFSISGAISLPFIIVAFNQKRIAEWVKGHARRFTWWAPILTVVLILLIVIWTQKSLGSGIKAAITVVLLLIVLVGVITQIITALVMTATPSSSSSSSSSSDNGSLLSDRWA